MTAFRCIKTWLVLHMLVQWHYWITKRSKAINKMISYTCAFPAKTTLDICYDKESSTLLIQPF